MQGSSDAMARLSREESKERTRRQLLDAARSVLLQVGYQGARLDEIASAAGYTKGAVYFHFPNKQALFMALIEDSIGQSFVRLEQLLAAAGNDPERLKRLMAQFIDTIDEGETLPTFGVDLEVESRRDSSFREVHQRLIVEHEGGLARFLARYFEIVGETPAMPPEELAKNLITIFKGFALSRQNRPDQPPNSAKTVRLLMGLPIED